MSGGIPAVVGTSVDGYLQFGNDILHYSQHVNFIDATGHVHELYNNGSGWIDNDLTAAANGVPAALIGVSGIPQTSGLDGYVLSDNSQHVNFIDANGHVHELYKPTDSAWVDNDLTAAASGVPVASAARRDEG